MAKLLWSLALLASTESGRPSGLRALFARDAPGRAARSIAAEPEKIEKRCRTQERVGVDATGREVRASVACKGVCRESCEGC